MLDDVAWLGGPRAGGHSSSSATPRRTAGALLDTRGAPAPAIRFVLPLPAAPRCHPLATGPECWDGTSHPRPLEGSPL